MFHKLSRVILDIQISFKIISSILYQWRKVIEKKKCHTKKISYFATIEFLIVFTFNTSVLVEFENSLSAIRRVNGEGWERSESKRWRNGDIVLPERGKRDRRHRSAPAPCFGSVEAPASLPPLLLFSLFPPPRLVSQLFPPVPRFLSRFRLPLGIAEPWKRSKRKCTPTAGVVGRRCPHPGALARIPRLRPLQPPINKYEMHRLNSSRVVDPARLV